MTKSVEMMLGVLSRNTETGSQKRSLSLARQWGRRGDVMGVREG